MWKRLDRHIQITRRTSVPPQRANGFTIDNYARRPPGELGR